MFVKVVREREENVYTESIFECERVNITPINLTASLDNKEPERGLRFDLEGPNDNYISLEISLKGSESVYLMNSEGRTIERYRWDK